MKNLSLTALCMAFTTVLALAGPLNAAPRYRYHDLGTLGGITARPSASTAKAKW